MISIASPSLPLTPSSFACIRCSERKVRCDKQNPCDACVRHNVQCIFRPPKSLGKRRKLAEDAVPASFVAEQQATTFKPQLLHGQWGTKLVDNLWLRVVEEIPDAEEGLEEEPPNNASDDGLSNADFAYALGWHDPKTASSHPPPNHILQLWQTFVENVNPLTKVVHVPSLQPAIEKAIADLEHVPKGFEALMFSMYSMAVLSLTEDECQKQLGETRATLLPRYVAATKVALSRAEFMSSTSIVVMQALVLHIFSIRDSYDSRAVWSLTGLAIRVAEGMGMRLDGSLLGLSPFETEVRRRIWWQLKMHDFRVAELCGQAKFRDFALDETTPKKPANVNDSELFPAMTKPAAESTRPTEMIWIVLRSELANCAANQKAKMQKMGKVGLTSEEYAAMDDLKMKDQFIFDIEDMIETRFLRFCDPSEPLQLLTLLGARYATSLIRFVAHHPRRWAGRLDQIPASEQQLVRSIVFQLLERCNMMQSSPHLQRFAWNVPYFIQWQAVIHLLDILRVDPLHADTPKAWRLVDKLYENNAEMLLNTSKPIFAAVGNLCLKAYSARAAALTGEGYALPSPPKYITKLEEQRHQAKARREVSLRASKTQNASPGEKRMAVTDANVTSSGANLNPTEAHGEVGLQQSLAEPVQGSSQVGDDAFWLGNALDDTFSAEGEAETMNLDMDAILTQDHWLDTSSHGEVIDWGQWDVWFGSIGGGPG